VEEIKDPSDKLIEVHLAVLQYKFTSHAVQALRANSTRPGKAARFGSRVFVKTNMPKKKGEENDWKFEKAYSIPRFPTSPSGLSIY
jgi:hypothetical protein